MPFDGKAMAADVLKSVREFVARSMAPLEVRFAAVESRVAGFPDMIVFEGKLTEKMVAEIKRVWEEFPKPKDGKDWDPQAVADMLNERFAQLPKPKDGEPGKSVTIDDVRPLI